VISKPDKLRAYKNRELPGTLALKPEAGGDRRQTSLRRGRRTSAGGASTGVTSLSSKPSGTAADAGFAKNTENPAKRVRAITASAPEHLGSFLS
jgi:hypothetical protein